MTCCIIRDTIFIFWRRRNEWQSSQWHFLETSLVFDMNVHICKYLLLATSNIQPLWYFNKTIHFIRYGKWNSAFSIYNIMWLKEVHIFSAFMFLFCTFNDISCALVILTHNISISICNLISMWFFDLVHLWVTFCYS